VPKPIAIHASSLVTTMAATAFLVTDGTSTWLVTCVHAFSNLKDTPEELRFFQRSHVQVLDGGLIIPLFANGLKRFVVNIENGTNILWDVISIKLSIAETAALSEYGAFALDQISVPKKNDDIILTGFPGLDRQATPFTTSAAKIVDIKGASIEFDQPSVPGWSGSPVVHNGNLVGMVHGDRGPPSKPYAGLAINLRFFKDYLFV